MEKMNSYQATSSDTMDTEDVGTLLSHQLRTPLSAIRWMSEMMIDRDLGELTLEQHSYVEQIQSNQKQLATMIDELVENMRKVTT